MPVGFEGDNILGAQADILTVSQSVAMGNLEANYRQTGWALREFELILGVRYMGYQEGSNMYVSDDGATYINQAPGKSDPCPFNTPDATDALTRLQYYWILTKYIQKNK